MPVVKKPISKKRPVGIPIPNVNLGRKKKVDKNDKKHLIRSLLRTTVKKKSTKTSRYWNANGYWGHQGNMPHCVGFAWLHWLEDGPVTQPGKVPVVDPHGIYHLAQRVDEWPGENYDGTSVRAGAKVLQKLGFIGEYLWAWDLETMIDTLLNVGPVVVGTDWHYDMFEPNRNGVITATGRVVGGHAYVINGVNTKTKMLRIKNSWGQQWGKKGHAWISFSDFEKLIKSGGEICLARELRIAA